MGPRRRNLRPKRSRWGSYPKGRVDPTVRANNWAVRAYTDWEGNVKGEAVFVVSVNKRKREAVISRYGSETRVPLYSLTPLVNRNRMNGPVEHQTLGVIDGHKISKKKAKWGRW